MDPSRYARAFGVQSESNKATVTRVASNEIVYRRVVDTYRRDMASTMTSIQREQKKLKRNMRGYRRKLREAQNLPMKKRKPYKIGWIAYDPEASFLDLPLEKNKHNKSEGEDKVAKSKGATKPETDSKAVPSSKLQAQVDFFLKSVDDHVHNAHARKQDADDVDEGDEVFFDKNGRRRFLFGSGGIGISSDALKGLELELEGYHFDNNEHFSDSSSEDDDQRSARKFSRHKRPADLLRLNSAYFTPIDFKESDRDLSSLEAISETLPNDKESASKQNDGDESNAQSSVQDSTPINSSSLPPLPPDIVIKPVTDIQLRTIFKTHSNEIPSSQPISRDTHATDTDHGQNNAITQNQATQYSNQRSNKVNFGDLIKFKHGVNTKKLFSMVDQLASKYGISNREGENENKRTQGSIRLRTQPNQESFDNELNSKSSIFYAMKYGYGKRAALAQNDRGHDSNEPSIKASPLDTHHANVQASKLGERIHEMKGKQRIHDLNSDKSILHEEDMVDGGPVISSERIERKQEFPFLNVYSPTGSRNSIDGKLAFERGDNGATPLDATHPFKNNDNLIRKRRSSILDASNYISNLRRRAVMQEHDKLFGTKNSSERFGPRRKPAALRKETGMSEHQRKADDNKIAWSSALGQMKLVHTIADLTHFI